MRRSFWRNEMPLALLKSSLFLSKSMYISALIWYAMLMYLTTYIFMSFRNVHLSPPALHFLYFYFHQSKSFRKKRFCTCHFNGFSLSPRLLKQSFLCSWPGREIICIMLPLPYWISARHQEICFEGHFPGSGAGVSPPSVWDWHKLCSLAKPLAPEWEQLLCSTWAVSSCRMGVDGKARSASWWLIPTRMLAVFP